MSDAAPHLAELLDSQFAELVEHWRARAEARSSRPPELAAHLPVLLRRLIADLDARPADTAPPASSAALPLTMLRRPFDLEAVVYEFGLLQRVVLELLEGASVPVSMRDVRLLGDWFTRAVASAAAEHAQPGPGSARSEAVDTQRSTEITPASVRAAALPAVFHADPIGGDRPGRDAAAGARRRLRALLEQAPVAVSVLRAPELVYEFANGLARAMAGGREMLGRTVSEVFPQLEGSPVLDLLRKVYTSGQAHCADEYVVPLDRRGDGSVEDVYFKFTCQPICDDGGRVRDILIVASDVSASVEARRRIETLLAELTLADQRKDQFLAMLAHELRNPMAAISTALSLLDQANGDSQRAERYRETARRQMTNLVRLVDDLLDVARITRGKVELRREDVDLATIVQHALAATRIAIEARRHELTVTVAPGTFHVSADATRLEQVIVNLLTNAAKYTEPGGSIGVLVAREETSSGDFAIVSVRDSGRGIPREMLDKVFELFTQVSPSIDRESGGLGLGLTLVKHLIEMHGGSASAESAGPGQGSQFSIRLPLLDHPTVPESEPLTAPTVPLLRRRVVVVEDAEDVRELLRECIEQLGHEVLVAPNGLEGAALIGRGLPDIALVDVGLPGIDGYEVARRVRAGHAGRRPVLVALTGYGGADVAKMARDAGFDLHITKPIEMERLRSMLGAPLEADA